MQNGSDVTAPRQIIRSWTIWGKPQLSSGPSLSFGYSLQPRVGGSPIRRTSPSVWGFCSELCSAWSASSSWPACLQIQKQHRAGRRRVGIQTPPVAAHRDIGTARLGCDLPRVRTRQQPTRCSVPSIRRWPPSQTAANTFWPRYRFASRQGQKCYKELLPRNCCPRPLRQQTRPRWPHWLTGERECGRIGSTGSPTGSAPATVSLSEVPAAACMCSF